jgi:hypothetical protein
MFHYDQAVEQAFAGYRMKLRHRRRLLIAPAGKRSRLAVILLAASLAPGLVLAQAPVLELDHAYIVVEPPVSRATEALRRAGLTVDTGITHHDGQGTASLAVFFDNAYLELLWVDPGTPVDSAHLGDLADFNRAARWRTSGASPFGIGLHFLAGTSADLPIRARQAPAPHLGPAAFYLLLRQPQDSLEADIFIMPASAAVPAWISRYRGRRPDLFAHALGASRITRVVLYGPPTNRPRAADLTVQRVTFEVAETQYMLVELDAGRQGRVWDLRPALPLVLHR